MRLLLAECRRAICSKRFAFAAIGYGVLLCLNVFDYWNDSAVYHFNQVYTTAFYMMCFVCAALPFADSYLQDLRSGAWRNIVVRSGADNYCTVKPIAVFLSGFLAVVLGSCILVGYLLIVFPLNDNPYRNYDGYAALLNNDNYFLFFAVKILLTSWSSAMLAVVALALSCFVKNTYAVLAAPVLLYYILNEFYNYGFIPLEWSITRMLYFPMEKFGGYTTNVLVSLSAWGIVALLAGVLFYFRARRTLKYA